MVLVTVLIFSKFLQGAESTAFVSSAIYGLVTFLVVETVGGLLDKSQETMSAAAKAGSAPSSIWKCWTPPSPSTG